jgi:hypothetical protein
VVQFLTDEDVSGRNDKYCARQDGPHILDCCGDGTLLCSQEERCSQPRCHVILLHQSECMKRATQALQQTKSLMHGAECNVLPNSGMLG